MFERAMKCRREFIQRKSKFLQGQTKFEDYKRCLEESLSDVCDTWQNCIDDLGISDPACIAWQLCKREIEDELKAICVLVD